MEEYKIFFEDIDAHVEGRVGNECGLELLMVGYVALIFAGLRPIRGTKDVDALKTETLQDAENAGLVEFLEKEFGKKSPGLYRHGIYLDLVPRNVIWIPPDPEYKDVIRLKNIIVKALNPEDVCVSKFFSFLKSQMRRSNDKMDIINSLEHEVISIDHLVERLEVAFPHHEMNAEAPTIFPMALKFVDELIQRYDTSISLEYELPNWMLNM